jgi:hypothetical protein
MSLFHPAKKTIELKSETEIDNKQLEGLIHSAYTVKIVNDTNRKLVAEIHEKDNIINAKNTEIKALRDKLTKLGQILGGNK